MKRDEIISGIKQAEIKALSIIESAKAARDGRVLQAGRDAEKIVADAAASAKRSSELAVSAAVSEIQKECEVLLQKEMADIELYREKAKKNVPKAKDLLLESFEGVFSA